jgi:hypothetical protein
MNRLLTAHHGEPDQRDRERAFRDLDRVADELLVLFVRGLAAPGVSLDALSQPWDTSS